MFIIAKIYHFGKIDVKYNITLVILFFINNIRQQFKQKKNADWCVSYQCASMNSYSIIIQSC